VSRASRHLQSVAVVLALLGLTVQAAGPVLSTNLAAAALLPQGPGLAAAVTVHASLDAHPDVIFADDFESGALGARWDETGNRDNRVLSLADPDQAGLGRCCLRVEAHLGQDTGGGLTKWFPPADRVFIRFYTRFDRACDYVHHFVTLRANRGLRGGDRWSGFGGAGIKPAGDERFSTAIEPWGDWGRNPPPGRWNFYSYWHEMRVSRDGKFWGNSFAVPEAPAIVRDCWICVEFMLRHNTPGQPDGEQAFWINGEKMAHLGPGFPVGTWIWDGFYPDDDGEPFEGFQWRNVQDLNINYVWLEHYVPSDPNCGCWFDDLVIAKKYIFYKGEINPALPHSGRAGLNLII